MRSVSTPGSVLAAPRLRGQERKSYRRHTAAGELPPVVCTKLFVERGIMVTMRDGVRLATDHWYPADGASGKIMLVRTPYGRAGNAVLATLWTERGWHVVVQQCRGTFDSEGQFFPFRHEADDGVDTLAWLRDEPWGTGTLHTWGPSYLGATQWALAGQGGQDAAVIAQSARHFDAATVYVGGGFSMETALTWMQALEAQNKGLFARLWAMARLPARVRSSAMTLPMQLADVSAVGHPVDYFRDWVAHREPGDPWWLPMHFATDLSVVPPLVLVAGWQDMFLPDQLADYAALRAAGRQVRLIIGDWTHHSPGAGLTTVAESFRLPAHPGEPLTGAAVRYEIAGGGGWRECESWPPVTSSALWYLAVDEPPQAAPGTTTEQLRTAVSEAAVDELSQATSGTATEQLRTAISEAAVDELSQATSGTATLSHRVVRNRRTQRGASLGSGLLQSVPGATAEVSYRYDPANPTPQAGGRSLNPFECGRRSQRAREARQDVVLFTSEPLATTLDIVGTATFVAEFSSSNPRVDLMVRLCDVDERGVSHTVTDGYVRMIAADIARCADTLERSVEVSDNITKCGDTLKRNVELADVCQLGSDIPVEDTSTRRRSFVLQLDPTAYRFAAGHCLRLQVSSGAHPLHLRNLGSDDPVTAQHPTASEQQLFLGLTGCRLELPVLG